MSPSRRDFLKTTIVAGAGMALPAMAASSNGVPAFESSDDQLASASMANGDEYTRGIGIYPGAPQEDFSPSLAIDSSTYRNLALLRPAYHSSSYDYNLTAQLVTDGIKDTQLPAWVAVSIDGRGILRKEEREILLDHFPASIVELPGSNPSVQIELGGGEGPPAVDRIAVFVVVPVQVSAETLTFTVSASDDGRVWKKVGTTTAPKPLSPTNYPPDLVRRSQLFFPEIPLEQVCRNRCYQVTCAVSVPPTEELPLLWSMGQIAFYRGGDRVQIGGPYSFTSAWMSAGSGEEWVYVDLGARCEFDRVALYWIARAAEGSLQVSDDAQSWRDLQPLSDGTSDGTGLVEEIKLAPPAQARYVRVLMTRPTSPNGYLLSEIEVNGRGGPVARPKPATAASANGWLDLAGGGWRLRRSNLVGAPAGAAGETLSRVNFDDSDWIVATVPGTVLSSYLNVEAIPDPIFGQNQLSISDSYFYSDFWYRTEFQAPPVATGQRAWLNFDGINWKADVFLNGEKLGRIEGGFMRGQFDVTGKLLAGKANALAVKVEKNATPGSAKQKTFESSGRNGGALGADNPTYHASIGWDWIPTIRGRNTGIWGDVYLTVTGEVTLENPFVTTTLPLPDTSRADVSIEVDVVNHHAKPITGKLHGRFGDALFERRVTIEGSSRKKVTFDPSTDAALRLKNPELWWPVGYGEPHLYDVELSFEAKHKKPLDKKAFKAGVRQMTYSEDGGALKMWINGRRFIARGGNWGFGESMLRYRAREYDAAVRYHREMNFTMIRNWVGQIGDDAFYEACDRHGVMVWQDFWLANPWDGPVPADDALFMSNVRDTVLRIRNHASVGLYCGRNEGFPPKPLDDGIRNVLAELHPGLHYIPSSADKVVSGHGPYGALPLTFYFRNADSKLHSEIGMPAIPPIESVRAMMPETSIWPQGLDWGLHDFCLQGAQDGKGFQTIVEESYGGANNAEEWISLAQFVTYEGYRAMFEAQSRFRMGLLLWMSHPCWPSFVWQTYDYYLEPTSAYFGCKKASEPLHIQWNRDTDTIEVVNYSAGNMKGLAARAELLNMDGSTMWTKTAALDSMEDSTAACTRIEPVAGLSAVHFLRLTLARGGDILSTNFYLRGLAEGDYRAIRELPKAQVQAATSAVRQGDRWILTTELSNISKTPALMTRLKVVRERSGDRILPAIYSDNYIALMPGERRIITTELNHADTRGENPRIVAGGFNINALYTTS
jgi:Exo-beta-D-glucosaminidase Ig-fold domain/F5/8 type C domain/Glycosyl hydrolases family 2/Glycosyl hydrolases family 2, sugar binding domain/TAT (twin-arginine translocation) pathway signal sequence